MSYYAGLDVSMKQTSIAIVDLKGKFVYETISDSEPETIANILKNTGFKLEKIGIESGCISFWLIDELKKLDINAICIESKHMAAMIALKINKTDKNDARAIAEAMRCSLYKEVHHKTKEAIEVGLQMGARRTLVEVRTKLKNSIRGFLKAYGIRLGSVSHVKFTEMVRNHVKGYGESIQSVFEGLLKSYEEVCQNIELYEIELEKLCKADPIIQLLESIPGIGKITAMTYKAVIDDPFRFKDSRDVGAYLGLTPNQYSSGDTVRQGRISKCGCQELRTLLVECGVVILTRTAGWSRLKAWGLRIMKRSGVSKASVAVARKLAIIMLKMWQQKKGFIMGEKKITNKDKISIPA